MSKNKICCPNCHNTVRFKRTNTAQFVCSNCGAKIEYSFKDVLYVNGMSLIIAVIVAYSLGLLDNIVRVITKPPTDATYNIIFILLACAVAIFFFVYMRIVLLNNVLLRSFKSGSQ